MWPGIVQFVVVLISDSSYLGVCLHDGNTSRCVWTNAKYPQSAKATRIKVLRAI